MNTSTGTGKTATASRRDLGANGISVRYQGAPDMWSAQVEFDSGDHGRFGRVTGEIRLEYVGPLGDVVDLVKRSAEEIGVRFASEAFLVCDDSEEWRQPPPGWREAIMQQAERVGFHTTYGAVAETPDDELDALAVP
jgi:hypothetical protein